MIHSGPACALTAICLLRARQKTESLNEDYRLGDHYDKCQKIAFSLSLSFLVSEKLSGPNTKNTLDSPWIGCDMSHSAHAVGGCP